MLNIFCFYIRIKEFCIERSIEGIKSMWDILKYSRGIHELLFFSLCYSFPFKDEDVRCYHLNTLLSKKQGEKKVKSKHKNGFQNIFFKEKFLQKLKHLFFFLALLSQEEIIPEQTSLSFHKYTKSFILKPKQLEIGKYILTESCKILFTHFLKSSQGWSKKPRRASKTNSTANILPVKSGK